MRVPTYQSQERAAVVKQPLASGADPAGAALRNIGEAAQGLGAVLQQRVNERKEKQNIADASNGFNAYVEKDIAFRMELKNKKGAEARNVADDYKAWHNDAIKQFKKDYTHNPESEALFDRFAVKHYLSKIGTISKYQAQQERVYHDSVLARDLQNIEADVLDDPYATIETKDGEVSAVEDKIETYNIKAVNLIGGAYTADVAGDIEAKIKSAAISGMIVKDPERAEQFIEKWKKDIGPEAYVKFKAKAKEVEHDQKVEAVYSVAMGQTLGQGEKTIKASGLPGADKQKLLGWLRTEKEIQQKEIDDAEKARQEEQTLWALQNISTLTFEQINKLNTSTEDKQMLTNKVTARGDKIKKTGKDPVEEHDPAYLSDLDVQINTAPETVDLQVQGWNRVGDGKNGGVTAKQMEQRQKRLEDRLKETTRGQSIKQSQDYLDALKKTEFYGEKGTVEALNEYIKWGESLNAYIEENPDDQAPFEWLKKQLNADVKGFWSKVANSVIGAPGRLIYDWTHPDVTPDELEEIQKGNMPESVRKRFAVPDERIKAIQTLRDAGQPITEANIQYVMDNS